MLSIAKGRRNLLIAPSRQFGLAAIVTLVALRLCIGWHFYKEGVKHLHDPDFSSAPMLASATGPWADSFHELAGTDFHRWDELLAQPVKFDPEAEPSAEDPDSEIPAGAPYKAWAEQVTQDWRARLHVYLDHYPLEEGQQQAAAAVYEARKQQLYGYLADASGDIAEYQHELYRLEQLKSQATAEDVPFQQRRIAKMQQELAGEAAVWKSDIRGFETGYAADLSRALDLTDEQQLEARSLLQEDRLTQIDRAVTYLTIGVGACLLLGLFTRVASVAGAVFLLSVIATQPPWAAGATPVYYQAVEMFALLVLAAVGAGRWGGLDYFTYHMFRRCCAAEGSK